MDTLYLEIPAIDSFAVRLIRILSLWLLLLPCFCLGIFAHAEKPAGNHVPDSVITALQDASEITIYSIYPDVTPLGWRKGSFHGFPILGQGVLTGATDLATVRATLVASVEAYDDSNATCCFQPRHGFRLQSHGHTIDIQVCFECAKLFIHQDETLIARLSVSGRPQAFDDILKRLGVPLPPPAPPKTPAKAADPGTPGIPGLLP